MQIKKIILILFILFFSSVSNADEIFLSLKKNKVNVRYGPSFESPVKYIYKKLNLPIKQIDKKENSGWIHWSQLKPLNSIIPLNDKILFDKPTIFSKPIAKIKRGRMLVVQNCVGDWCKIKTNEYKGWIEKNNVWGKID